MYESYSRSGEYLSNADHLILARCSWCSHYLYVVQCRCCSWLSLLLLVVMVLMVVVVGGGGCYCIRGKFLWFMLEHLWFPGHVFSACQHLWQMQTCNARLLVGAHAFVFVSVLVVSLAGFVSQICN